MWVSLLVALGLRAPPRVVRAEEFFGWDLPSTESFYGFKATRKGEPLVGDKLSVPYASGKRRLFEIKKVDNPPDPGDMYLLVVKDLGYEEEVR